MDIGSKRDYLTKKSMLDKTMRVDISSTRDHLTKKSMLAKAMRVDKITSKRNSLMRKTCKLRP